MSFAVWLTGHSGSGKSAIARELVRLLHERGVEVSVLESDVMRTQLTPFPRYDEQDRNFFYGFLGNIGVGLVEEGKAVIFDATANRRAYREAARKRIARFAEVYVDTPLEVCRARDPKGLYRQGMTIAYEVPVAPELTLRGDGGTPAQSAAALMAFLEARTWISAAR
ncbi:MAG TPA: adenylyl-sulfate kinase [Burkholderiales bacterium]|nr:adenylyl-sulfate kinase [Burkholderiales bacterium]